MNGDVEHSRYHPRWLRRRVSTYWWLKRWAYMSFITRELSSVFVAWFVIYLLMLVNAVSGGADSYAAFMEWSGRSLVLIVNAVALAFVVFHAITWFNLAPRAMVVHMGKEKVPPVVIAASNYGAWVAATAVLAWLILGG